MTENNEQEKRHRGSSPPFQRADDKTYKFAITLASNDQVGDAAQSRQLVMQYGVDQNQTSHASDGAHSVNESQSRAEVSNDGKSRSNNDDVSRWQDDGGESGEDV
jgi:hypothetical protein